MDIKVEYGKELGKNLSLEELENKYDAIFLSFGANIPAKMNIEGEDLPGVFGGNSLLETGNHPSYAGKKVAVIGGGNVAMDCARTIKRLGADKVFVIYRRAEKQMPAEKKEIEEAKEEGIEFLDEYKPEYYEEKLIYGMVIGYTKMPIEIRLKYLDEFVPIMDNWAVCDGACATYKFTTNNLEDMWKYIQKYINSEKEFEVRFAVVMLSLIHI